VSPDYCRECEQATSRKAKLVEVTPTLAIITGMFFWFLTPTIFNVDLRFITLVFDLSGLNYAAYNGFQELSALGFFALIPYLVTARIRNMYRRGLRISWGFFPFWFWLRFHWLKSEPKPDATSIA
jgi:hypothetical protein